MLLIDLLPVASSACFLMAPSIISQKVSLSTVIWALPHYQEKYTTGQSGVCLGEVFSQFRFLLSK